jgi:hypothetical protein
LAEDPIKTPFAISIIATDEILLITLRFRAGADRDAIESCMFQIADAFAAVERLSVLAASGIRSILAVRKRALRRERVIEGGTMGTSAKSSPNAWRAESRVCLARRRNNFTSKAKTVPEI